MAQEGEATSPGVRRISYRRGIRFPSNVAASRALCGDFENSEAKAPLRPVRRLPRCSERLFRLTVHRSDGTKTRSPQGIRGECSTKGLCGRQRSVTQDPSGASEPDGFAAASSQGNRFMALVGAIARTAGRRAVRRRGGGRAIWQIVRLVAFQLPTGYRRSLGSAT